MYFVIARYPTELPTEGFGGVSEYTYKKFYAGKFLGINSDGYPSLAQDFQQAKWFRNHEEARKQIARWPHLQKILELSFLQCTIDSPKEAD